MTAKEIYSLFERQVEDYHKKDDIDAATKNPYGDGSYESLLWEKNWIDTVQWHLEDLIRPADIDPVEALGLKRRIDALNQQRTQLVEKIDDHYVEEFAGVKPQADATLNTETPGWAIDRLSILALKIYHFTIEADRAQAGDEHLERCRQKLAVLLSQRSDLTEAIDLLLNDIREGRKKMKTYRQMKMYNDPSLNPELYKK
ncbi:MAG: DUF4254 domain-containing protein [Bacteroidales bacterium]|nr:DUF4254 domain-containing protein [Bacteroidales bacterium]